MNERNEKLQQKFIETWKDIIKYEINWVLFSNGTVVICDQNFKDLENEAKKFLNENGQIVTGAPLGDLGLLDKDKGWIYFSHSEELMTLILPEECDEELKGIKDRLQIGLYGQQKRGKDAEELKVIFVKK